MKACIKALRDTADVRSLDIHLAQFAASMDAEPSIAVFVATALASRAVGQGHVCAEVADYVAWAEQRPELGCPTDPQQWREALRAAQATQAMTEHDSALLVLDGADRVYLMRYFNNEQTVARHLRAALESVDPVASTDNLRQGLDLLFPLSEEADWQRAAVAVALRQRFCVISGGPGTGKTRTVARLLCLLQHHAEQPLRMALAAPTGKAAARLALSIQRELPELQDKLPTAAARVPTEASTVHRLLGYQSQGRYRHHAGNPLALDLLLVDEASMLDLAMMACLLAAIPSHARLIFLGDRDQLASVEAGNVLGDICGDRFDDVSAEMKHYLQPLTEHITEQLTLADNTVGDGICLLRRSYRFDADSAVGAVASAINRGDWLGTESLLQAGNTDLQYFAEQSEGHKAAGDRLLVHFRALLQCETAAQALSQLSRFQLLCGLRKGDAGVESLNVKMAQLLRRAGLIDSAEHYKGRPIMVVQNDYAQGLYNGDVGLTWPDAQGKLQVWFESDEGELRSVLPARLPPHESGYAMTIHKTQGSEFKEICVLLPEQAAPILSRQLLYTGVTRAREKIVLCGPLAVVQHMVGSSVQRRSGLRAAIDKPQDTRV